MPTNCSSTTIHEQLLVRREVRARQADQHLVLPSLGRCGGRTPSSTRSAIWSGVSAGAMPSSGRRGCRRSGCAGRARRSRGRRRARRRTARRVAVSRSCRSAWALSMNGGGPNGAFLPFWCGLVELGGEVRADGDHHRHRQPHPVEDPLGHEDHAGPAGRGSRPAPSSKASSPPAGLIASSAAAISSAALSGKTRKIVPSAIPAAWAISLVRDVAAPLDQQRDQGRQDRRPAVLRGEWRGARCHAATLTE